MATDALGPSNSPDDDGLETPDRILYSDLSTGGVHGSTQTQIRSHTESICLALKHRLDL